VFEADDADANDVPFCDICDRTFPTFASLDSHLTGRSHAAGLLAHDRGVERALVAVDRILACVDATRPAERHPVETAASASATIWSRSNPAGTVVNPLHMALIDSLHAYQIQIFHDQSRREWRSFVTSIRRGARAMVRDAEQRTIDEHIHMQQQDSAAIDGSTLGAEFEFEDRYWSDHSEDMFDDYQDEQQEDEQFE
jgi:hypothetical protein